MKEMTLFRIQVGVRLHEVHAWTAGEARSVIKKKLGLKRLPAGVHAIKVQEKVDDVKPVE